MTGEAQTPEPDEDPSVRWATVADFTGVVLQFNDDTTLEVPADAFKDRDRARLGVGLIVQVNTDDTVEVPEPKYATPDELAAEEADAREWIARATHQDIS